MGMLIGGSDLTSRLSDSTYIDQVDQGVRYLEEAISSIIGIPLNREISTPIFARDGSSAVTAVQSDGTIDGELRFWTLNANQFSTSPGITWKNDASGARFKLAVINNDFWLLAWDSLVEQWTDATEEGARKLNAITDNTFKGLDDTPSIYGAGTALKFLRMDATGEEVELVDVAPGAGASSLEDLTDIDSYTGLVDKHKVLAIEDPDNPVTGLGTYWRTLDSATVGLITDLDDVYGDDPDDPIDADDNWSELCIGLLGGGYKVAFQKALRCVSGSWSATTWNSSWWIIPAGVTPKADHTLPPNVKQELWFWAASNNRFNMFQDLSAAYGRPDLFRAGLYVIALHIVVERLQYGVVNINAAAYDPNYVAPMLAVTISPARTKQLDGTFYHPLITRTIIGVANSIFPSTPATIASFTRDATVRIGVTWSLEGGGTPDPGDAPIIKSVICSVIRLGAPLDLV